MTFPKLSPAHKNTVYTGLECIDDKQRVHPSRTHYPHGPHIGRVLKTSHARRISRRIAAPIAQKTEYFGFKWFFGHPFLMVDYG